MTYETPMLGAETTEELLDPSPQSIVERRVVWAARELVAIKAQLFKLNATLDSIEATLKQLL